MTALDHFAPHYPTRQSPHYEVWYGKVDLPDERALWFRYTTLNGVIKEAATWAIFFSPDGIQTGKTRWWLEELLPTGPLSPRDEPESPLGPTTRFARRHAAFRVADAHLDDGNALGSAGSISWDLFWENRGLSFSYIPHGLHQAGLAKSTYDDCFMDLRVSGVIQAGSERVEFENARGMLGHIQGSQIAGADWAWAHCNHCDDHPDAVFEGLSARALLPGGRKSPLLTAMVLFLDGQRYSFHGPLQILNHQSDFDRHRWNFLATQGDLQLYGEARAPAQVALVRYTDTDGSHLFCFNSKLATLSLKLIDPKRPEPVHLTSTGRSAFEVVTRDRPDLPLDL